MSSYLVRCKEDEAFDKHASGQFASIVSFFSKFYLALTEKSRQTNEERREESGLMEDQSRVAKVEVSDLSEILNFDTFNFLCSEMKKRMEEKKWKEVSLFVSALRGVVEMVCTLLEDSPSHESFAKSFSLQMFYRAPLITEPLFSLLRNFLSSKLPKAYLRDLVAIAHNLLQILLILQKKRHLVLVQRNSRKKTESENEQDGELFYEPSDLLRKLVTRKIVSQYLLLLQDFPLNPPKTNEHVFHFLHHFSDPQRPFKQIFLPNLLFQVSTFRLFASLLKSPLFLEGMQHWIGFIKRLIRLFISSTSSLSNKALYPLLLFQRSKRDYLTLLLKDEFVSLK